MPVLACEKSGEGLTETMLLSAGNLNEMTTRCIKILFIGTTGRIPRHLSVDTKPDIIAVGPFI